ncbi:M16 family metallopeptidase [Streptomyces sp. NPDC008313]|uniref:M16 family metallopeptidase n=1 Tax=Streptomyces sp. NPDC008313 TaxID=3364826 RepID=UPI0036E4860E
MTATSLVPSPAGEPARTHRSAAEIGRTAAGARPLPPLEARRGHRLPATADTVLPNGLRVIAARQPSTPMVELRMSVPFAGTTFAHAATAEVLATLLFRRGHNEGAGREARMARQGVTLSAHRSSRWLQVSGSAPGHALGTLVGALADAVTDVSADEAEIGPVRDRMARQIALIRAQPQVIAQEALVAHCYGELPALQEVPFPAPVAAVTGAAVRALHHERLRPGGTVLVLVGDLDPERAVEAVAAATRSWDAGGPSPAPATLPPPHAGRVALVPRADAVQSQIKLVRPVVARTDDRFPALSLATLVFGGYFSSRLVTGIREEKGLAYRAEAGFEDHLDRLVLTVDADTATQVTATAYREIRAELGRLATVPPSAAEVDAAREYTVGMTMLTLASQAGFAGSVATAVCLGHEPERVTAFPELLRGVTRDQVARAAREFFDPDAFSGVVVGDADRLASGLRAVGGVEIADGEVTDGAVRV